MFDTAAFHHFTKFKKLLFDYELIVNEEMSVTVDGVTFPGEGKGAIKMSLNGIHIISIMYYTPPKLRCNPISGPKIDEMGGNYIGKNGKIITVTNLLSSLNLNREFICSFLNV